MFHFFSLMFRLYCGCNANIFWMFSVLYPAVAGLCGLHTSHQECMRLTQSLIFKFYMQVFMGSLYLLNSHSNTDVNRFLIPSIL
jgi:hypothetical protein